MAVTSATNLTVSIDGAAVTNHTVADTDTVSNAELVGILNTAFDGAATPIAITASVGGTQTPRIRSSSRPTLPLSGNSAPSR